MFNMAEFVKTNLITGYWEGSFSEAQVNIFATNYLMRGMITQADFDEIIAGIQPKPEPEEPLEEEIVE